MRDMLGFEGASNKVISAFVHGFDRTLDTAVSRNHNDWRIILSLTQFPQHIHAANLGHHVIKNNQLGTKSFELFEGLRPVIRGFDSITGARQDLLDNPSV